MKETGVVRRLDELGRVVIPKEIRKRLKINNGDMVDIFTNDEKIVLQKYHPLNQDILPIKALLDTLASENACDLILFDDSIILYSTDENLKSNDILSMDFVKRLDTYLDKELSRRLNIEIVDNYVLNNDMYIQKIFINYEKYGYVCVVKDMITKKQKDIINMVINYLNVLLSDN